jgi:hypothetical protein
MQNKKGDTKKTEKTILAEVRKAAIEEAKRLDKKFKGQEINIAEVTCGEKEIFGVKKKKS